VAQSLERNLSLTSLDLCRFAEIDAFHAGVILHVSSDNKIGNEAAEALTRSLERTSSLSCRSALPGFTSTNIRLPKRSPGAQAQDELGAFPT
jgi:hypothetical protein